jgi:acyl-CoA dehydrogenase
VERTIFTPEHEAFRRQVRAFLEGEVVPDFAEWEKEAKPPKEFWRRAGELGMLGIGVPEEYGGLPGSDFRHSVVVTEEAQRLGLAIGGVRVHTDICMPYFLEYATEEQCERWLPRLARGEAAVALAMSEPGAGSDVKAMSTRAVRDGDHYIVNGTKTFISNGRGADLIILATKTDPAAGRRGITLLVVEASSPGFERGPSLEKVGLKAQDLCELYFTDVAVPVGDRLGEENRGFEYLTSNLAQERLSIGVNAQAAAAATLDCTVEAFSRGNGDRRNAAGNGGASQHVKFEIAACAAEVEAGQAFTDRAVEGHVAGSLTPADAAAVKLFCTELQGRVADRCLQLFGADGYRRDSRIGRAYADARVSRIFGGSSEIMKVIVAQDLGL